MGDFSGRGSRGVRERIGPDRDPIAVDVDELDGLLARLSVEIRLFRGGDTSTVLRPRSLEDLHPDRMLARELPFQELRRIRLGLEDPQRFADAARTVRGWGGKETPAPPASGRAAEGPAPSGADLLDQILGGPPASRKRPEADADGLGAFVAEIVRPHAVGPGDAAEKAGLIARADQEIGLAMRSALHDPAFQAVEAAWRGLDFLLRHMESGEDLRVSILDVTHEEIAEDLKSARDLAESGMHRILAGSPREEATPDWWAVAGLFEFGPTIDHAALLARLAKIADVAGAPFLAAAAPALLAAESFEDPLEPRRWQAAAGQPAEELWAALRRMPGGRRIGLAAPRFLLRLPYGAKTDAAETFAFEEFEGGWSHADYLWGNPALLCLLALDSPGAVTGLPLHVFERSGETRIQPCADRILSPAVLEAMLERGIIPVVALPDRDAVRVARLQSIADSSAPLAVS